MVWTGVDVSRFVQLLQVSQISPLSSSGSGHVYSATEPCSNVCNFSPTFLFTLNFSISQSTMAGVMMDGAADVCKVGLDEMLYCYPTERQDVRTLMNA